MTALTRALRRHGDRARIAFSLIAKEKATPGGGRQPLDREGWIALLTQALLLWHGLFNGKRWADPWSAAEWKKHDLPEIAPPPEAEDITGPARRAQRQALEDLLKPHVERLADQDLSDWSKAWSDRWLADDVLWSGKDGILRRLRHWIVPRGLRTLTQDSVATKARKKAARAAARHVGGLSVDRIGTLSGLYQLLKAFKMRPEPDDPRKNVPKRGDDELANFNRRLLDVRCGPRAAASSIWPAGLSRRRWGLDGSRSPRRASSRSDHGFDRMPPVMPSSLNRSHITDRTTQVHASRKPHVDAMVEQQEMQKLLQDGCQLYGLHLREVPANYTSRQDSRTGRPGERCDDVPVEEFLTAPWWNKVVHAAQRKIDEKNSTDAEAQFLVDLRKKCESLPPAKRKRQVVRVRRQGGDLFVAAPIEADNNGQCLRALQADLNAAANIGVRALLDPDFAGKWWYVP